MRGQGTMGRRLRLAVLLLGCGPLVGCPGSVLRTELEGIKSRIDLARENGAYLCAPRELALAESNYDFAKAELGYGNYFPAKEHKELAEKNANLAVDKSPRNRCIYHEGPLPPPILAPKIGDRDGDGILDNVDKCPDDPEDKDGFEDADGCPDPDNDKDGILDKDDKCPDQPGPKENQGCPDTDKDGDGVVDRLDKCPDQPGPKENDGCPDPDRDGDGVVDRLDKCPDQPGPPPSGCPEKKFIIIKDDKIELRQKIHFATNKAKIFPDSFPLLNEVVDVLKQRPTLELRIEGHTDNRGKLKRNMVLSDERANSVRTYLVHAGIDEGRLTAKGFGPTQPIGNNKTASGREQNRRTEFFITKN